MGTDRVSKTSPGSFGTEEAKNPFGKESISCHPVPTGKAADSTHVECIAPLGYMQEKALMTPNDRRSSQVC